MDLKFNSWSIYQTDFIANSGQRGITDHGSDGSLLLVPGSRYPLVLWWPLASHVGSSVQGSPVICSDSDKKFIQLSRWLTTGGDTIVNANSRVKLFACVRVSAECSVDMCYVDMLACCMRPCLHFPPPRQYHCLYDGCTVCCHRPLSPGLSLSVKL